MLICKKKEVLELGVFRAMGFWFQRHGIIIFFMSPVLKGNLNEMERFYIGIRIIVLRFFYALSIKLQRFMTYLLQSKCLLYGIKCIFTEKILWCHYDKML